MTDTDRRLPIHLLKALVACGFVYSLLYAVVIDAIAATLYKGYSRTSQAISELSATAAPTGRLLSATVPGFTVLMVAFGIGVCCSARMNQALRVTGGLLIAHGATLPLWLLAPMTTRGSTAAVLATNDIGHLVLVAMTFLLILAEIRFGAIAFGRHFWRYSMLTAITVLVFGALTGAQAIRILTREPTPWLGLFERALVWTWLLWVAVLSIVLVRWLGSGSRHGVRP